MADPLSVAGLAAGVVSLGLQVAKGISDYINALQGREQDILSVRQQNESLRRTLQVVESPLALLKHDHQDATAAVHECLNACKRELEVLASLMVNVTACDQTTTVQKEKIKNQGKKLLYPFSRPKLEQLDTRLRNANSALHLALQTLGLSVSQLGTEKLATLEETSHNISSGFRVVQSEISAIKTPLQGIHSSLSGVETRFNNVEMLLKQLLIRQPAENRKILQELPPAVATGRLVAKPGVLRDLCDATGAGASQKSAGTLPAMYPESTPIGTSLSTYALGRLPCWCSHRRRLQRKKAVWGSFTFSIEMIAEQHSPGCPATYMITDYDQSRKIGLTYTGLRRLLDSAVQLSFAISSGAGGWSLSPNFIYYPTVDSATAPAFRMISLLSGVGLHDLRWRGDFIPVVVSAILKLFRAKKAHPRAVDADHRSLIYHVVKRISAVSFGDRWMPSLAKSQPLLELLEYLLVNKASANDYDLSGDTPVNAMFSWMGRNGVTHPLPRAAAELILRSNTEGHMAFLAGSTSPRLTFMEFRFGRNIQVSGTAGVLYFLTCSTRVAEAYGCGPLSLAIISSNTKQVEHLVKNHPTTLTERNLFGYTPLHLAAGKLLCLQLLVQALEEAGDARLLDQIETKSESGESALETALFLSGLRCRERISRRMCQQCKCADCAVILLKANCALPVPARLQKFFNNASQRCKLEYIRHLKDRRDKLKQLARQCLPVTEVARLGLATERTLNSLAPHVLQLLQHHNVQIPEALAVQRTNLPESPSSVYQALENPGDAELFFQQGFHDTDVFYDDGTLDLNGCAVLRRESLPYLYWLAKHGAVSCQLESLESRRNLLATHYIFLKVGENLQYWRKKDVESMVAFPLATRKAWIHELNAAALPASIADVCCCRCSHEGCTPLTSLLKGVFRWSDLRRKILRMSTHAISKGTEYPSSLEHFILYIECFGSSLEVEQHTAALRFLTYTALNIPHSCCKPYKRKRGNSKVIDAADIEGEYGYELALLEELLGELEGKLISILLDPYHDIADLIRFWTLIWLVRMKEVLDRHEGSDVTDDEKRGAEEIGVVWEKMGPQPRKVTQNPYPINTLDHWTYELKKIEAECELDRD